ncbi:MAG: DNA repair protein RecN [Candidatus Omnitrophota bacterium]
MARSKQLGSLILLVKVIFAIMFFMISQLTIQNIGLIDKLTIDFRRHLNILTGETGAGKSILIDALRFVLGERVNTSLVRNPELSCTVEAIFEIQKKSLSEYDAFLEFFNQENQLIINRSYLPDGRSKIKINGFTVTLTQLKNLGDSLVDFHGPHDHQLLFSVQSHIKMLDRLSNIDALKQSYLENYHKYSELLKKQSELKEMAVSREKELDTLKYQINELSSVPLDQVKYEELLTEQKKLNNRERISENLNTVIAMLENDETGVNETIRKAFGAMKNLNNIDESTKNFMEQLNTLQETGDELLNNLIAYRDSLCFDTETTQNINSRCDIYYSIKRKYGPTLESALKFFEEAKEKYELISNLEHNTASLNKEITSLQEELEKAADKISKQRKKTASALQKTIEKELKDLGIKQVEFECRVKKTALNQDGCDSVEFYISPNAGESLKPLAEIVSSGEAARVMLALKKALIEVDLIPVLIFDEIDAQIGGRLGTITGRKLKELSCGRQVILITHLPQIASFADAHYKVVKTVKANRTFTTIEYLENETRVKELAAMMSDEKQSPIAINHAREMLAKAGE